MTIGILGNPAQKQEFERISAEEGTEFVWADSIRSLLIIEAEIYIDLLFEPDENRIRQLKKLNGLVIINSVALTSKQLNVSFARIAGWPTLLGRPSMEIALSDLSNEEILKESGLKYTLVPDTKGMVTPRIIAMIINEAYFALHENVSSRENIDTAMKTGTNYPYGPFEWAEKIGENLIAQLLTELSRTDQRYELAPHFKNLLNKY